MSNRDILELTQVFVIPSLRFHNTETNMFTEQCLYCQRLFSLMKRKALLEREGQHYSSKRDRFSLIRGSKI